MKRLGRTIAWLTLAAFVSGCSLWDSGTEWKGGPYTLGWTDTYDNMFVAYELASGDAIGRIPSTVYSVGWDGRYLVAKQHPGGKKSEVGYFYVDSSADSPTTDPARTVVGPLSQEQFAQQARVLGLPSFSRTIEELE